MTSESMQKIFDLKLVPLVVLDDATDAVPMAKALVEGGIPVAEVTFPDRLGCRRSSGPWPSRCRRSW